MKTALILTGHLRDWSRAYPSMKREFMDKYQPDVFVSTWDNLGYWVSPENDSHHTGLNQYSPHLSITEIDNFKNLYATQNSYPYFDDEHFGWLETEFKNRAKEFEPFCNQIRPVNILSAFYKMARGVLLMEKHVARTGEPYDVVIRTRPDIVWNGSFPELNQDSVHNTVYTINHKNHDGLGTGDMLQISSFEGIVKFKELVYNLPLLTKLNNRFCPHIFTKYWIDKVMNYDLIELDIPKFIAHTPNGQYIDYIPQHG